MATDHQDAGTVRVRRQELGSIAGHGVYQQAEFGVLAADPGCPLRQLVCPLPAGGRLLLLVGGVPAPRNLQPHQLQRDTAPDGFERGELYGGITGPGSGEAGDYPDTRPGGLNVDSGPSSSTGLCECATT